MALVKRGGFARHPISRVYMNVRYIDICSVSSRQKNEEGGGGSMVVGVANGAVLEVLLAAETKCSSFKAIFLQFYTLCHVAERTFSV